MTPVAIGAFGRHLKVGRGTQNCSLNIYFRVGSTGVLFPAGSP
jgi:hypothetical protein